jgi:hypothetical protein
MDDSIQRLVESLSKRLLEQGAKATALVGSHARGAATEYSDIDVFALGEGPHEWLERVDGRLVAVYWWTTEEARQRMIKPDSALLAVGGWATAVVLDDPYGIAAELQAEARDWSWDKLAGEADAWVADKTVGWAEYVQKLVGALESGRTLDVCAIRAELALRLCEVLAVHRRVATDSENGLWETVAEAGGPEWRSAQERAFGVHGGDVQETAAGALELVELLAREVEPLVDDRQRAVIDHAVDAARRWRTAQHGKETR